MDIEKSDLLSAAAKAGLSKQSIEALWTALNEHPHQEASKFDLSRVLYYFGALIVITAMGWFVGSAWESFGGGGIFAIALTYILIFLAIGSTLWRKEGLRTPGGLFITMAVCLIPLAVYGLQKWSGWWVTDVPGEYKDFVSWVKGGWFFMEVATVIGGCLALKFYRFPFLTLPIFFTLWFMSMDVTPLIFKNTETFWNARLWVSIVFGIAVLIIAYLTDLKRTHDDFAFWGYLFGLAAFWTGISLLESSSELQRFIYFLINIGLILLSVLLQRTVFLIFGAIGVLIYVTTLFYKYFSESAWFPLVLSLIGLGVIFIGMLYHKNRHRIEASILNVLPASALSWLPKPKK